MSVPGSLLAELGAVSLRRAGPADAGLIWALCGQAAGRPASVPMPLPLREALFDVPCRSWAWLAEAERQVVGLVVASVGLVLPQGGYCLAVDALYVVPGWRRRGVGSRLQQHLCAVAGEMGCEGLRLADGSLHPVRR